MHGCIKVFEVTICVSMRPCGGALHTHMAACGCTGGNVPLQPAPAVDEAGAASALLLRDVHCALLRAYQVTVRQQPSCWVIPDDWPSATDRKANSDDGSTRRVIIRVSRRKSCHHGEMDSGSASHFGHYCEVCGGECQLQIVAVCHAQEKLQPEAALIPARASMDCADSAKDEAPSWPGSCGVVLLTAPLGWIGRASRVPYHRC